jgi:RNA polymerase sigma factor (sigma-70 family)
MSDRAVPPQQGDEQELFERYEGRLRRITALSVRTSRDIVDDACAFAWMSLLTHQPRRETVFPWLRTVARHEALRLDGLQRSHVPLAQDESDSERRVTVPEPRARRRTAETSQGLLELRERLHGLPSREREAVFLHAAGWRYVDLAERLGISYTRVNQILTRASVRMREMDIQEHDVTSPRGRRLQQIEQAPPTYIVASLGSLASLPPHQRRHGFEETRREWRRLALAIEDYRSRHGVTDRVLALGEAHSADPARESLARRIAGFRRDRGLVREIEL